MIRKYYYLLLALCLLLPLASGCSSDEEENGGNPTIDDIEFTEEGSKRFVLYAIDNGNGLTLDEAIPSQVKIGADKQISGNGYSFSEAFGCNSLSGLPAHTAVKQWNAKAVAKAGTSYWVRYQLPLEEVFFKLRVAYVGGINVGVEHNYAGIVKLKNDNANTPVDGQVYVTGFEMPRLLVGNTYVEHVVTVGGSTVLNYAIEWNDKMKHAQWVAFSFDATTGVKNVNRTDAWATDPLLPADMRTDNTWHTNDGFDRGHLCASDDRAFSTEANRQTFYFSNMSPQLNSFNSGVWVTFEQLLLSWVRQGNAFGSTYDKVYVAKGGTLDQLLLNFIGSKPGGDKVTPVTDAKGFTPKGLPVPRYYYMAVLAHRANQAAGGASAYQSIAFLVEHSDDYGYTFEHPLKREDAKEYAVSIDRLEQATGIDFFCNLPDEVEEAVEGAYNVNDWTW